MRGEVTATEEVSKSWKRCFEASRNNPHFGSMVFAPTYVLTPVIDLSPPTSYPHSGGRTFAQRLISTTATLLTPLQAR
jgi:hypothetical protein